MGIQWIEEHWLTNNFICKELYAPFVVDKDCDYLPNLQNKYEILKNQAICAGADDESVDILKYFSGQVIKSVKKYYAADLEESSKIIKDLLVSIGEDSFAVANLNESFAFPGMRGSEIQLFRCREGAPSTSYTAKDMLHLPVSMRSKTGNYRFSIPGNPSMYLSNSSYGCWIETGYLSDDCFNVSPVLLDGTQRIFNLAVSIRLFDHLDNFNESRIHTWLKLLVLSIATSYRVNENDRSFKSEYVVSQAIMMACKKLGYSGIAYFSRRASVESFAICAINLALFVDYEGEYSNIIKHMKIDDPVNFSIYKKLMHSLTDKEYELRCVNTGYITNIGNYSRQFPYRETEFYYFDRFLFSSWQDKTNGKDSIPWGVDIDFL